MQTVCWDDNESDILANVLPCHTDNNITVIIYYLKPNIYWFTSSIFMCQANKLPRTCGINIRRSCTMAWNQASTKSAWEREILPDLLTYSGLQASNVRSKFFFTPGGAYRQSKHTVSPSTC